MPYDAPIPSNTFQCYTQVQGVAFRPVAHNVKYSHLLIPSPQLPRCTPLGATPHLLLLFQPLCKRSCAIRGSDELSGKGEVF